MGKSILVILTLFKLLFLLKANNISYCVVDGDAPGIFLHETDTPLSSPKSKFLDNTTEIVNFTKFLPKTTKWKLMHSSDNESEINQPVLDQRWETFPILAPTPKIEKSNFISFKSDKWRHIKVTDSKLYDCDNLTCVETDENFGNYSLWKIHDYYYFYTEEETYEKIYTMKENCTLIENGCFRIFLAMCQQCKIEIRINPFLGNTTTIHFFGHKFWETKQMSLTKISSCFDVTIVTKNNFSEKPFWAIGDVAYISSNYSCGENKRYINFTSQEAHCENAFNEYINPTTNLPAPQKKKIITNMVHRSSPSLRMVRLLFITPVILITTIIFCAFFCILKRSKDNNVKDTPEMDYKMESLLKTSTITNNQLSENAQ